MIRLRNNGLNGILADEMGLGKTLQSISMLGYLHEFKRINGPHLVLVPKTTLSNWMNEFRRWLPALTAFKFHGSKEERGYMTSGILVSEPRAWDVVVTTYEVANRAAKGCEIPNFKGSYLGRFPLVSADFWTSDHLSERSRSVDAFSGTRARGTLTLKRR